MSDSSTISCYDDHARAYDAYQSAIVPCYDDMLGLVAQTCQRYLGKSPMILDLGCGTGNASVAVLKRISASIYLVDGSSRLVERGRFFAGEHPLAVPLCRTDGGQEGPRSLKNIEAMHQAQKPLSAAC